MKDNMTINEITNKVSNASTAFEKCNTDLKRKYLLWNVQAFNIIAKSVSVCKGTFGTGYPFYALDTKFEGKLPIIPEQIRYNRQLVIDGKPYQKSIWQCQSCIKTKYAEMPDLKKICKPCPYIANSLKPRKIINRLPDIDMWLVCEDGKVEQAEKELSVLLKKYDMFTSDYDPLLTIDNFEKTVDALVKNKTPKLLLPIDTHIVPYSQIKALIKRTPFTLENSWKNNIVPYLPIYPKSYRKNWQYDDEAYNYIYDFLSAFTEFNFPEELQKELDFSRKLVAMDFPNNILFDFLVQSATKSNARRFNTPELESIFYNKMDEWRYMPYPKKNIKSIEKEL